MKDSAAIISRLLFELLKTRASAGQVLNLFDHGQSLWKYMGREGLFGSRLRLSDMKPVAGNWGHHFVILWGW